LGAVLETIVVTGASGFVAKHVIGELLRAGYRVRGTYRGRNKLRAIHASMNALAPAMEDRLDLVQADLLDDAGWSSIMENASAVIHVAATIVAEEPKDPSVVIRPAVEGTERVLRFAHAEGIKRVIMTSSIATVGYGHGHEAGPRTYTEDDFTNLSQLRRPWAYCIGKTRAEQAAWAFASGKGLELTTIHPGAILGPATDPETSVSLGLVSGLLDGSTPAMPRIGFAISDVRDVAEMHLAALRNPQSIAHRYLCTGPYTTFEDVAAILRQHYPDYPVTLRSVPDWLMRILAAFGGPARQIINDIGNQKHFDGSKGEKLLGRPYHTPEEAILSTAESLIRFGLVKTPVKPEE
jgi:dihydroflavonol-4-reductase